MIGISFLKDYSFKLSKFLELEEKEKREREREERERKREKERERGREGGKIGLS